MDDSLERLDRLLAQVERQGLQRLPAADVIDLGRCYRRAAARLSRARGEPGSAAELERLNRVVAQAYSHIYTAPPSRGAALGKLLLCDFPDAVRRHWRVIALAFAACCLGVLMGAGLTAVNRQMPDLLLGSGWSDELQRLADRHAGVKNWMPDTDRPMNSALIITNNIRVSFLAYSTGLLLGLGPLYLMWYNGVMVGAIGTVVAQAHVATSFWAFVAPHGVLELTAVFISGGAGFLMAWAFIRPAPWTRAEAIRRAALESLPLMAGVIAMLLIAGTFEAFFDPVPEIPYSVKFVMSSLLFVCMSTFFLIGGRRSATSPPVSGPGSDSIRPA